MKQYVAIVGFIDGLSFYGPFDDIDQATAWADGHGDQGLPISIQPMNRVEVQVLAKDEPIKPGMLSS